VSPLLLGAANLAIGLLGLALLLCLVRLVRGPSVPDRILALDTLYVEAVAMLVVIGIRFAERAYLDGALVIALLGFVGTVALAKYHLQGDIID
jgi:multicomponent K+:H+ antiporter subunit F